MESMLIYFPILLSLLGLAYMTYKKSWVIKQDAGDGKMKEISDDIHDGALAFLNSEYKLLSIFVVVVSLALAGVSMIVPTTNILIETGYKVKRFNCWYVLSSCWMLFTIKRR